MIQIYINGKIDSIESDLSLVKVLEKQGYQTQTGFAVAINQQFIPRSAYEKILLKANDQIEIVSPMQGG
jgi:sulfur carrier protein